MTKADTTVQRYLKLAVLVVIAGNIYPLIYLRQNFEVSILESFGITAQQLSQNYAMLGLLYVVTYIPSGWLADRVSPRILMSFSLLLAGILGVWFSTFPNFFALQIIFAGWGIAAGLTFWSSLIKATTLLAQSHEQGRFFGILDGGRGLVEAILASIVLAVFAYYTTSVGEDTAQALQRVIYIYVGCMLVLAPVSFFVLHEPLPPREEQQAQNRATSFWSDLRLIAKKEEIWLSGVCILTGYQLFWATYSFSAYLQTQYGLTAVTVGLITVAKLWTRPVGAVAAGFAGDMIDREATLSCLLVLAALSLLALCFVSVNAATSLILTIVLAVGFLTYAVRGIFWSTLESCGIDNRIKGLAIGVLSLVGYSPDIYLPLLNGYLLEQYPGKQGYTVYFQLIAGAGFIGALAAWRLRFLVAQRCAK